MSFRDVVEADAAGLFLNEDDFAESISYTPAGGIAKTISCQVETGESSFNPSAVALAGTRKEILISSVDNVSGHVDVKFRGEYLSNGGDQVVFASDPTTTWYVIDRTEAANGMQRLTLTTNAADV